MRTVQTAPTCLRWERGMERMLPEEFVLLVRQALYFGRQLAVQLPEALGGKGSEGHPDRQRFCGRPSSNGRNLPARTSAFISSSNTTPAPPDVKSRSISASHAAWSRSASQ